MRNYPALARQIQTLAWVQDGLSDLERSAVDELLWMAAEDIANLEAALRLSWIRNDIQEAEYEALDRLGCLDTPEPANLYAALNIPWVQDNISETEYDIIDSLCALDFDATEVVFQLLSMPFLTSPDTTDALAIRGMEELADEGRLAALTDHPVFQDGIADEETTLIAAVGALRDADEIQRALDPGGAAVETVSLGTELTPHLKISIVRTDSQSRPGTIEATRDLIQFVENTMGLALPVDHVIIMLSENAVTDRFAGTNYGFAFSYLPKYEATQHGTHDWRQSRLGFVHETAHYFWGGNENWIDEGLANLFEYRYGRRIGLSHGQLQTKRKNCEAHDLEMLSGWDPDSGEWDRYQCNYYLGQLLFQDLFASMDASTFAASLQEYYRLSLESQEADRTPGIVEVRKAFVGQDAIIDRHWSGKMNAPENRPFDEGYEFTSHNLIKWTRHPTYEDGVVTFEGIFLNGAEPSFRLPRPRGPQYSNFALTTTDDGKWLGSILEPLSGNRTWTLDDPGDVVADTYLIDNASNTFTVAFDFPEGLGDNPSDYAVRVRGFQNSEREATIGENIDTLGYARIRIPPTSTLKPIPSPTQTPTPTPTATATPTPSPTPTATPLPSVDLALTASATVVGYWSDGTANVDVDVTLRNDGQLALNTPQLVALACPGDCGGEKNLSLEDGFGPASAQFTLRLPMGRTALEIAYGNDETMALDVNVPERILGVDREVWECYSDRRPETDTSSGCYGSGNQTVVKWLTDVPIKVWATGDARHIDSLRQVLDELGTMMRAEFEWVETEDEADFRAHVGISRSEAPTLGFSPDTVDWWGFASTTVRNGEVLFGYVVVWLQDGELRDADIRGVIAHEAMHALLPTGHPSRPVSIIGKYPDPDRYPASAGLNTWSPMDRSLMELNYHPLVQPGMSMSDVGEVIALTEELLDQPPKRPIDATEALWQAYIALEEAGTARFKLSGGWIDRQCNWLFGRRRGPIEWTIGRFHLFEQDPSLTFLDIHADQFIFGYSREERKWLHWRLASSGAWEMVERSVLTDATNWLLSSRRLHRTIRALLSVDGDPEDIAIQRADGYLALSATMDASRIWNTSDRGDWDGEVFFELVVDPETFAIRGFTLEERHSEGHCRVYREVATDGQVGVTMDVPAAIREALSD